jgi:hypothetical protein
MATCPTWSTLHQENAGVELTTAMTGSTGVLARAVEDDAGACAKFPRLE